MTNPCTDKLTDMEYLEHMIPHHQVAIDMSHLLIKENNIKNPDVLTLCRNIIFTQGYEIWEMDFIKKTTINTVSSEKKPMVDKLNDTTKLDLFNPILSKSKDGSCNPLFFKPDDHMKHMEHMKINDKSYLEHMIPHHQVAVDMSKRLLLHTNNTYLMEFCRKLIINQQGEIYHMNNLLNNNFNYISPLLTNGF